MIIIRNNGYLVQYSSQFIVCVECDLVEKCWSLPYCTAYKPNSKA